MNEYHFVFVKKKKKLLYLGLGPYQTGESGPKFTLRGGLYVGRIIRTPSEAKQHNKQNRLNISLSGHS
jgi:hypothetical protein